MAVQGVPVVLVDNGPPAVIGLRGFPITIVGTSGGDNAIVTNMFTTDLGTVSVSASGDDYTQMNVSGGTLTSVSVALVPTKTIVSDTQALVVPVTGTYTTTATLTVAGGVVTAIVLS